MSPKQAIVASQLSKTFLLRHPRSNGALSRVKDFIAPQYQGHRAVQEVSFSIAAGERVALIGPNGAGKSTTIKMLTGIMHPTSGSLIVAGLNPALERQQLTYRIGCVFGQRSQLWPDLSVQDSLRAICVMFDVSADSYQERVRTIAEPLGVDKLMTRRPSSLSLGERMRCELFAALVHSPSVLFLDEPSIGLDLLAKIALREIIKKENKVRGTTVLFTSHDMADIEDVCERVILINHGTIVCDQPLAKMTATFRTHKRCVVVSATEDSSVELHEGVEIVERTSGQLVLGIDTGKVPLDRALTGILKKFSPTDLSVSDPTLESVLVDLYQQPRGEHAK